MTAFTAAYPEIEIEAEQVEPRQLHDTLVTSLASGTPPNAIMLRSDSMPYFADARALASLDALFERDGVRRGWFRPRELAARTWDSQLYGLPHVSVGAEQMLYVNLGLLERLGRDPAQPISTWAQIMALVEPARRIGAVALDPTRCASGVLALQVWGYAAGGRWLDDGGRQVTWAEPPVVEAAEWMQQIVAAQRGEATLPPVGEPGASALTVQEWALQKHVCCVNDAAWQARLAQEAPHLRFAVYEVPAPDRVPSGQHRSPSFGGWLLAIPRAGRDQEAAWEWLKHLALGNTADELAQLQGRPPPLAATPGAVPDSRPSPVAPVVLAAQVHSVVVPAPPTKARLDDIAREAQVALFSQRPSPGPILQAAARDGQQLLDEWHGTRRRA
jgi:ABC-type glycerol-3-phosphate transport system substrate-binding protein